MSTYTNIRYDYNLPSGFGGSLTLLQTNTITSGVANSSFTSGIDSSYGTYLFKFINIHPSALREEFQMNLSTDGGSNYNVTKTDTFWYMYHGESAGDVNDPSFYDASYDVAQSTGYTTISSNTGNGNDEGTTGELYLFSPSSTTFVKHYIARIGKNFQDNSGNNYCGADFSGGYGNTTSAVDAIDFKYSSGNIDSGIIKMYGIA